MLMQLEEIIMFSQTRTITQSLDQGSGNGLLNSGANTIVGNSNLVANSNYNTVGGKSNTIVQSNGNFVLGSGNLIG